MSELKTKKTTQSVAAFVALIKLGFTDMKKKYPTKRP